MPAFSRIGLKSSMYGHLLGDNYINAECYTFDTIFFFLVEWTKKRSFCDWCESVAGHVFPGSPTTATTATSTFCIVTLGGYLTSALSRFNPTSPAYCQITGSEGNLVHLAAAAGLKNRREKMERSCQMSSLSPPQLPSRLLLFFFIFAAKRQREIKGGRHERLRLCFSMPCLAALSLTDMEMLNPKSSLHLWCI